MALKEYGSSAVVIDVAVGNEIALDNKHRVLPISDDLRRKVEWSLPFVNFALTLAAGFLNEEPLKAMQLMSVATGAMAIAYVTVKHELFNSLYRHNQADTVKLIPNVMVTVLQSLLGEKNQTFTFDQLKRRHNHWLLIRNSARIKVLGIIRSPEEAIKYTQDLE